MDSNISMMTTIYIPLLNEGIPVSRPTKGKFFSDGFYEVLATDDYDTQLEEWEFPPGTFVECKTEFEDGKEFLRAFRRVDG